MVQYGASLKKCEEICYKYGKAVPGIRDDEIFYQFCDDMIRMGFLVAASDSYVMPEEIDLINRTFGLTHTYTSLSREYGLDSISDTSFMKQIPPCIIMIASLEKQQSPDPNHILSDTREIYAAMKHFGNLMLNSTSATLQFSVMVQTYFINNILRYIFSMEEMDGVIYAGKIMENINSSFSRIIRRNSAPAPQPVKEKTEKISTSGLRLKINSPSESASHSTENDAQEYKDRKEMDETLSFVRGHLQLASGQRGSQMEEKKKNDPDDIDMDEIKSILAEVDSLIGLGNVKKEIHDMVNIMLINEMRRRKGLKSPVMSRHLVFTGNPGTGKTTIARAIGKIYKTLGILEKGHMIETDRSGMVAGYVGQTAEKVNEIVNQAMGGILFIDEAYSLVSESEGDFGQEAINTLLKQMEDHRDSLIVIVAGYTNEMNSFINSNPGLRSRFNRYIQFDDYSNEELLQIFKLYIQEQDYSLEENSDEMILSAIEKLKESEQENFGNARSVRNYFEKVISNQANRLMSDMSAASDTDELMKIKCVDL